MATRVKRKKKKSDDKNAQTDNPLRPKLSDEEVAEQNRRVLTAVGVTAAVVLLVFIVLQFI